MPETIEFDGQLQETKQSAQITRYVQEINLHLLYIAQNTVQVDVREKCIDMLYFLSSKYPVLGVCEKCNSFFRNS